MYFSDFKNALTQAIKIFILLRKIFLVVITYHAPRINSMVHIFLIIYFLCIILVYINMKNLNLKKRWIWNMYYTLSLSNKRAVFKIMIKIFNNISLSYNLLYILNSLPVSQVNVIYWIKIMILWRITSGKFFTNCAAIMRQIFRYFGILE